MSELFRNVLNASFQGSIVIAAVLILRMMLKKAPKKYICLLWILAGIRLLMPFSIESKLSLQPQSEIVTEVQWQELQDYGQILPEDAQMELPQEAPPEVVPEMPVDRPVTVLPEQPTTEEIPAHAEPEVGYQLNWAAVLPALWLAGVAGMLFYSVISYLLLKQQIREATRLEDGTWETNKIGTAFILGYFWPRIYLPAGLNEQQRQMILEHEKCHLRRLDHWTKLIGFIALSVHWFNPLVWLAYGMLCQEIEMACDEQVVEKMDLSQRKCYSQALLAFSANGHLACPVAFGEKPVKKRIRAVLNYRKPAFWLTLCAVVAIVFVAVSLLTSPKAEQEEVVLRAGYAGPYEPYEIYHTTEREQKWEEDILYLAKEMLTKHPFLFAGDVFIYQDYFLDEYEFSNAMYDETKRQAFIDGIDTLIPKLGQWSDDRIPFEINKVIAAVGDSGNYLWFNQEGEELLLDLEAIWTDGEVGLHVIRIAEEHADLIFGKLTAINGIPIETIMERLMPCYAYVNEQWAIQWMVGMDSYSYLNYRGALEAAEVVEAGAESAEVTIRTDAGEKTITMDFLSGAEQKQIKQEFRSIFTADIPPHRHLNDKNVWCEVLEDTVYLRILNMPYGTTELDHALIQVTNTLRDAAEPMKLIIDLRIASQGNLEPRRLQTFAQQVNNFGNDGVYILVDSTTVYHAPAAAYLLRQWIENAAIVGSPTGHSLNRTVYCEGEGLPNSDLWFGVQEKYHMVDKNLGNAVLQPDVLVYQTLEDYKNGIDTVFQYALDAGKETAVLPKEQTIQNLYHELERIQNAEEIAFDVSTKIESDYEFFRGHEQSFWKHGDDWYRVFRYDTKQGSYEEEYLQTGGKQYVCQDVENIPKMGDLEWTQLPDGQVELPPLLTRDWTTCEVLEIRKEKTVNGGVVSVVLQGNMEQEPEITYLEHTHTFHLDENGQLVGVEEYTFADEYVNQLGTEGRFYIKARSLVSFKEIKPGIAEAVIETAAEEVRAVLGAE